MKPPDGPGRRKSAGSFTPILWALDQSDGLAPTSKHLLIAVCRYAGATGSNSYPSVDRLMADTLMSRRTVQTNLRALEDAGYILAEAGGGRNRTSRYRLPRYDASLKGASAAPFINNETAHLLRPLAVNPDAERAHLLPERAQNSTRKGASAAPKQLLTAKGTAKQAQRAKMPSQKAGVMPRLNDAVEAWHWLADRNDDGTPRVETGVHSASHLAQCAERGRDPEPISIEFIGMAIVGGFYLNAVAREVADAAGIHDQRWRPDWLVLCEWLREGIRSDTIIEAIRRVAARPNYQPPRPLAYFDGAVREAATRQSKY